MDVHEVNTSEDSGNCSIPKSKFIFSLFFSFSTFFSSFYLEIHPVVQL